MPSWGDCQQPLLHLYCYSYRIWPVYTGSRDLGQYGRNYCLWSNNWSVGSGMSPYVFKHAICMMLHIDGSISNLLSSFLVASLHPSCPETFAISEKRIHIALDSCYCTWSHQLIHCSSNNPSCLASWIYWDIFLAVDTCIVTGYGNWRRSVHVTMCPSVY